jgi:hypothetical protein
MTDRVGLSQRAISAAAVAGDFALVHASAGSALRRNPTAANWLAKDARESVEGAGVGRRVLVAVAHGE